VTKSMIDVLRDHLGAIADVRAAVQLLEWDQETYMPPKAAAGRGQQLATLSTLAHRLSTDPELGALLEALGQVDLGETDAKLVTEAHYDYDRATRLPEDFIHAFALARSAAYEAWVKARQASDYKQFQAPFGKLMDLHRRKAELYGYEGSPYNALLEDYERGMTTVELESLFAELAPWQSRLVARIADAPHQPDAAWLEQEGDEQKQWSLTLRVLRDMGYDLEAGRQDRSIHPFTTNFGLYDVRVTNRTNPRDLFSALTAAVHEGGHALYEQGFDPEVARTPLAEAPSLGMHESQSRMWENLIGRSLPFWKHYTPVLREQFPAQLDHVTPEQVFQAINRVRPSLIRVEADECTYNLHVVLRFEIEVALIEGKLNVAEVPDLWNEKMKEYLGLDVPNDAAGCLQDIHWSIGTLGYFPTYALGNLYAAQIFERLAQDLPDLWDQVEAGDFSHILKWLREHIHRHGRRKTAVQIVQDISGRMPAVDSYMRYLEGKYTALYGL